MESAYTLATLARRGVLVPGPPRATIRQLYALHRWGYGLAGELHAAAARDPDRLAIVDERGWLTYGELRSRSERLAGFLHGALGVAAVDRIGLLCRNHGGLVEGMVAASLLGVDVVLVNTGLSPAQLHTVAGEQRLRVLIHDNEFAEHVAALPHHVIALPASRAEHLLYTARPYQSGRRPGEGHTIVLTSGTTGTPKGARRPNPGGLAPLASILSRIPLLVGERMLIAAPLFHTWGYAALQVALALRATVVLQRRFEPGATLTALHRHGCTALFAVPVMLQRLLEAGACRPPGLRVVAVSGAALPGALATRFMAVHGDVLYNLYGSTEASWISIATPAQLCRYPQTAGRPPRGTRIEILGDDGLPLPPGRIGRIFVGNDMLFEGYTDGAARETREGLLATGDLGHLNRHGLLFVDGREDDMIISGGENVFPGEVEDLLARLPQVRDVTVSGVSDDRFGQRLAAWIVLYPGEWLDAEAVREYVRRYLARFSVPRDVHFLNALPRGPTGKVVPRYLPGRQ